MFRDDYLHRIIQRLSEALAAWADGKTQGKLDVEKTLQEATGLSMTMLDALPATAVLSMLKSNNALFAWRLKTVIRVLSTGGRDRGGGARGRASGESGGARGASGDAGPQGLVPGGRLVMGTGRYLTVGIAYWTAVVLR